MRNQKQQMILYRLVLAIWQNIGNSQGQTNQTEAIHQQQLVGKRILQQDCPTVEHEKIDVQNYNSKNAHKQRPPRNHAGVNLLTDHRENRSVVDVVKHNKQQKTAFVTNATKETKPHVVFQKALREDNYLRKMLSLDAWNHRDSMVHNCQFESSLN